jgi:hypothetical protein
LPLTRLQGNNGFVKNDVMYIKTKVEEIHWFVNGEMDAVWCDRKYNGQLRSINAIIYLQECYGFPK